MTKTCPNSLPTAPAEVLVHSQASRNEDPHPDLSGPRTPPARLLLPHEVEVVVAVVLAVVTALDYHSCPHLLSTFFGTIRLMCSAGTSSCLLSSSFVMISLREATSDSCKELRTSAGNSTSGCLLMAARPSYALLFYRSQNSIHKQFSATRLVLGTLAMTPAIGEKLKRGEQPPAHSLLQTSAPSVGPCVCSSSPMTNCCQTQSSRSFNKATAAMALLHQRPLHPRVGCQTAGAKMS